MKTLITTAALTVSSFAFSAPQLPKLPEMLDLNFQSFLMSKMPDVSHFKISDKKRTYVDLSKIPQSIKDKPFRIPSLLELNEFIDFATIGVTMGEVNKGFYTAS
jgi:hypothetical protein